ncbi:unnamed protein product [Aphanomyces euteiches]
MKRVKDLAISCPVWSPLTTAKSLIIGLTALTTTAVMKIATTIAYLASALVVFSDAQQVGTNVPEVHPPLPSQTCTAAGCTTDNTKIVLDANWRWLHTVGGSTNCYTGNKWNSTLCPDPATCAKNCALDGADYAGTYGVTTSGNQVYLRLVTHGPYSTNVGSRLYLLEDDNKYKIYKLLNKEFTFDVDVSQLPCGLNGALYFVQMDQDGGKSKYSTNKAGAAYGTGYCDAQCPHDIKFINGEANVNNWMPNKGDPNAGVGQYGSCCAEMDIWESNSISQAYTSHPCARLGQYRCVNATECGDDDTGNRFDGVCDKDGCDFNPWRMNSHNFYGPGSQFAVDSTKPITVVTQFITDDNTDTGNLVEIKRFYVQNGVKIDNSAINWTGIDPINSITDQMCNQSKSLFGDPNDHAKKGGLKAMGEALKSGVVLTMSLWTDHAANCLWLDSSYPLNKNTSLPGVARGTCATTTGVPAQVEAQFPTATVKYGNIRVGDLGTTTGQVPPATVAPTTAPTTSSAPQSSSTPAYPTSPSSSSGPVVRYGQCGGKDYKGTTTCQADCVCHAYSEWYSQCLPPNEIPVPTQSPATSSSSAPAPCHVRYTSSPITPVPSASSPSTSALSNANSGPVAPFSQCGGKEYTGVTDCQAGWFCYKYTEYYSQCITQEQLATNAPSTTAPPNANNGPVAGFGQCGGKEYTGVTDCQAGWFCHKYTEYYSQCITDEQLATNPPPQAPCAPTSGPTSQPDMSIPCPGSDPTPSTPTPTTTATSVDTNAPVAPFGKCSGNDYNGPTDCQPGWTCHKYTEWFSQCIAAEVAPVDPKNLAAAWSQCGGNGFTGPTTCVVGYQCQKSNGYYSQCVQILTL